MSFEERLNRLNAEQTRAVNTIEGPVLVIAGPGSGKTELLSLRTANILKNTDALAQSILCITYTEAGAENMRERLKKLIGPDAYKIFISTFHGLGSFIINHYPEYFYKGATVSPMDDITRIQILEKIIKELDYKSDLRSEHPAQGFTYSKDIASSISELKESGISPSEFKDITDANEEFLNLANPILSNFFSERVSKAMISGLAKVIQTLEEIQITKLHSLRNFKQQKDLIIESLKEVDSLTSEEGTKPITKWKDKIFKKDDNKNLILKDLINIRKQKDLAGIYEKYQTACEDLGLYDYADMILETTRVIEKNPSLHYELAERFQYIMVDEFQDTNGSQMRLLDAIIDEEVSDNRPNILAVGDDDQAIFKFQGAKIENILNFHKKYRDPEIIVLTKNYRSHQSILNNIRKVILLGEERLENNPELKITKDLIQAGDIKEGEFEFNCYSSEIEEFKIISEKIKAQIESGTPASEIAVLMRKNISLEALAKILDMNKIRVSYERQGNILEEQHIVEIIRLLKFINSLANKSLFEADELLPEILSSKSFDLPAVDIWKLSLSCKSNQYWLTKLENHENEKLKSFAHFLISLSIKAKDDEAETIIDYIIGNLTINDYTSPYKSYYFSDEELTNNRRQYLERLSSLRKLISKLRSYKAKSSLKVKDLVEFIELHEAHSVPIFINNLYLDDNAVNLITVHSSKGLEFDTVYLAGVDEKSWKSKGFPKKLSFPQNLPISKDGEEDDDILRLLYVGMSRAKRNLFLSYHASSEGKNVQKNPLRFLHEFEVKEFFAPEEDISPLIGQKLNSHIIFNTDENAYLKEQLKTYKLSVTHLKNFLDTENGGPKYFLQKNLLRFPEKPSHFAAFGTAAHEALDSFHSSAKTWGSIPEKSVLLKIYEEKLSEMRIKRDEFDLLLEKGKSDLSAFYDQRLTSMDINDFNEFNFNDESVQVKDARIKGKLDRIHIKEGNKIEVIDYKTGKPFGSWDTLRTKKPTKHWHFEMQLYFYKILIENSRKFGGKYEVESGKFEFLEPEKSENKILTLSFIFDPEKEKRIKTLIEIVWDHIQNLRFPEIDIYPKSIQGIYAFEEDLLGNFATKI